MKAQRNLLGKQLPHSKDLEEAVLGAILVDKNSLMEVQEILTNSDIFYFPANQTIFESINNLSAKSEPIDILTVVTELNRMGKLEFVGGAFYIAGLANKVNSGLHVQTHCRKLQEAFIKRTIIHEAWTAADQGFDSTIDAIDLLSSLQTKLIGLNDLFSSKKEQHVGSIMRDCFMDVETKRNQENALTGIPSAINSINKVTGGWQPTDLIILAARPGMGKTAFTIHEAKYAAIHYDIPTAIFSLEMGAKQLVNRFISSETGLSSEKLKRPKLMNDLDLVRMVNNTAKLAGCPIYIDDTAGLSIQQFRAKATKMVAKYGIKFIIVDYLQLMRDPSQRNREQEIGSISRQLKQTAKELNVPVIALSQLSRAVETRGGDKRPILSDLRESGSLEQDADMVAFLYRPEYYFKENTEPEFVDKTEIIISKHRNGGLEDIWMDSFLDIMKYGDAGTLTRDIPQQPEYNLNRMPVSEFEESDPQF